MNWQYGPWSTGWKPEKKEHLAYELADKLGYLSSRTHIPGDFPFIQIDRGGDDVTISRITNLSDEDRNTLIDKAEKIYKEVMNQPQ